MVNKYYQFCPIKLDFPLNCQMVQFLSYLLYDCIIMRHMRHIETHETLFRLSVIPQERRSPIDPYPSIPLKPMQPIMTARSRPLSAAPPGDDPVCSPWSMTEHLFKGISISFSLRPGIASDKNCQVFDQFLLLYQCHYKNCQNVPKIVTENASFWP